MIKPIRREAVVRILPAPEKIGALYMPQYIDQTRNHAEVISVGDTCYDLAVGDKVLLPDSGGIILPNGDILVKEIDILAIL